MTAGSPHLATDGEQIDHAPIRDLLERIVASWDPEQIWLFGSRARRSAHPDSDWELFVVVSDEVCDSVLDPITAWRLRKDAGVRADVVPCRASDFDEDRTTPNTLAFEAATRGQLLYER